MKKTRILTLLLAVTLIITNFSGVFPVLKDLFSIPASAATEESEVEWTPQVTDWIGDQITTPADGYAYTFAAVGDTQSLMWYDLVTGANNLDKMYDWIVKEANAGNIDLVMGLGDISETNNCGKSEYPYANGKFDFTKSKINYTFNTSDNPRKNEWLYSETNIDKLAANNIPYTIVRGNHDKPSGTYTTEYNFNQYFKYEEYAAQYANGMVGRYDGKYADGSMENVYLKVEIGGVKYMIVTLDCGVASNYEKADDILEWANRVVAANKDYKVIVTTHMYLSSDGSKPDPNPSKQPEYYGLYGGQTIWNKFARKHENIFLILSGHHKTYDIGKSQVVGDKGNTVTQMMIDPQRIDMPENYPSTPGHGGTGLVALLHFAKDGKTLDVEYYSVIKDKYFRKQNQFSLNLNALDKNTAYTDSNHTHEYLGDCDTICELCLKETRTVTVQHTYFNNCDSTCNVCNTARNTDHSYTNSCDATCNNNCGTVRIPPHSYEDSKCTACEYPTDNNFRYTVRDNEVTITKYTGSEASVTIPDKINGYPVVYIGEYAFSYNRTLTSVTIPATIKNIGIYAFNNCNKLTTVNNNSTVMTAVGGYAFYKCTKLESINLSSPLCYIGPFAFYECSSLKKLEIPEGVTAIERETFNSCTALENIKFANTINIIRHHAFYNCTKLKTVILPDSLVTVERYAFCDCSGITTLVFPKALKTIVSYAFHCKNLKNVYYEGTTADKDQINIDYTVHESNKRHNGFLKDATWAYSSCLGNPTDFVHTYTDEYDSECDGCLKRTRVAERRPTETTTPTAPETTSPTNDVNTSSDSSTTTVIIIVVIVVALVVVGCCVFIVINSKKNKSTPETNDKKEEPKE